MEILNKLQDCVMLSYDKDTNKEISTLEFPKNTLQVTNEWEVTCKIMQEGGNAKNKRLVYFSNMQERDQYVIDNDIIEKEV